MITKAIITRIPEYNSDDNTWTVDVPVMGDNTGNIATFEAICNISPDIYYGYKVNDVVFVEFENDLYDTPIIIGKLFTGEVSEPSSFANFNQLNVVGSAKLPADTTLGNLSLKSLASSLQGINKGLTYKDMGAWDYVEEPWELTSEGGHWWEV